MQTTSLHARQTHASRRPGIHAWLLPLAGCLVLLASCATPAAPPGGQAAKADPSDVQREMAEFGMLDIFITDQLTDGRNLKLRGRITNPYSEPIEGIRLIYLDVSVGTPQRVLDHALKIIDTTVEAKASATLRWDIQTMYAGADGARFSLMAFAIKRGGASLPWPPGWEAGDDEKARASGG